MSSAEFFESVRAEQPSRDAHVALKGFRRNASPSTEYLGRISIEKAYTLGKELVELAYRGALPESFDGSIDLVIEIRGRA